VNTEPNIHVILFYKFTQIQSPESFVDSHMDFCVSEGLLGKVLVAKEGINGSLSGSKEQIERYKSYLTGQEQFSDIMFKEETSTFSPFKKMIVRVKKEIIRMDKELDLTKTGRYISPLELLELYESGEDFIMLDTRNNYESRVGKFKDAITPDIENFRDFPEALKSLDDKRDRKIVTYCTGGIRCEKATAYMIAEGFTDVYQLRDGIINFCQQYPDTIWEGKCFVFDQRLISDVDPDGGTISECVWCSKPTDRYTNCRNPVCDDLILMCENCGYEKSGCCSEGCLEKYERAISTKSRERQGYKFKQNIGKED
jgi:UPF0176 protein